MTTRAAHRYYAYSPELGKRRIPDDLTPAQAIEWAAGRGAINVIREDGPASKPTAVHMVWRQSEPTAYDIELKISNVLAEHFPNATVREIGEATKALVAALK